MKNINYIDPKYLTYLNKYWEEVIISPNKLRNLKKADNMIITLPNKFISPNRGLFNGELYYWDSYFNLLFFKEIGEKVDLTMGIIENLAFLIEKFGFIPNANRLDFLNRSHPPFFVMLLIDILDIKKQTKKVQERFINLLEKEYKYWNQNHPKYSVFKYTQTGLYRYFSDYNQESATCESGWDYSIRWFLPNDIGIIEEKTSNINPIDLNFLLLKTLELLSEYKEEYISQFTSLKEKINYYLWNDNDGVFYDYDFVNSKQTGYKTLAMYYPMFLGFCTKQEADKLVKNLEMFLFDGGLVTSTYYDYFQTTKPLQWNYPNGWAPLQYIVVKGLENYGYDDLALDIMKRFCNTCEISFDKIGSFCEKYNVVDLEISEIPQEGVYKNQLGFSWTNSIYMLFKKKIYESEK